MAVYVPTDDLSCHFHYDDASQLIIGARVAEAMATLLPAAPEPAMITATPSTSPTGRASLSPSVAGSSSPAGRASLSPSVASSTGPSGSPTTGSGSITTTAPIAASTGSSSIIVVDQLSSSPTGMTSLSPSVASSTGPSLKPSGSTGPSASPSIAPSSGANRSSENTEGVDTPSAAPSDSKLPSMNPSQQPSGVTVATNTPSAGPSNGTPLPSQSSSQPSIATAATNEPSSGPSLITSGGNNNNLPSQAPSPTSSDNINDLPSTGPSTITSGGGNDDLPSSQPSLRSSTPSTTTTTTTTTAPDGPTAKPTFQPSTPKPMDDRPSMQPSATPTKSPQPSVSPSDSTSSPTTEAPSFNVQEDDEPSASSAPSPDVFQALCTPISDSGIDAATCPVGKGKPVCTPYRSPDHCPAQDSFPLLIMQRERLVNENLADLENQGYWFQCLDYVGAGYAFSRSNGVPAPRVYCCIDSIDDLAGCSDTPNAPTSNFVIRASDLHSNLGTFIFPAGFGGGVELLRDMMTRWRTSWHWKQSPRDWLWKNSSRDPLLRRLCLMERDASSQARRRGKVNPYQLKGFGMCGAAIEKANDCVRNELLRYAKLLSSEIGVYMCIDFFVADDQRIYVQEYTRNHNGGLRHCATRLKSDGCVDSCFLGEMWNGTYGGSPTAVPPFLSGYFNKTAKDQCTVIVQPGSDDQLIAEQKRVIR